MPKFQYFPTKFNPVLGLISPKFINVSWSQLIWSAITVGRASWSKVVQHGMYSAFEIIYRGSLLRANLDESKNRELIKTDAYADLDPSEKAAVSYFLGLTISKYLSQRLFGVTWLMHLDVYKKYLTPLSITRGSRPDLVGQDGSFRWIVVEAKGRTRGITAKDKTKAKGQADKLTSIKGLPVYMGVGVIVYFNSGNNMEVYIEDPDPKLGMTLNVENNMFFNDYYKMFVDLIDSEYGIRKQLETNNSTFFIKNIKELDIDVGIDKTVYNIFKHGEDLPKDFLITHMAPSKRYEPLSLLDQPDIEERRVISEMQSITKDDNGSTHVGEDGILVQIGNSWQNRKILD